MADLKTKKREAAHKLITHLFWGKYPYKVQTIYPASKFTPSPAIPSATLNYGILYENSNRYREVIRNFKNLCERFSPSDRSTWSVSETSNSLHYYFIHEQDAERFMAGNKDRIKSFHRPENSAVLAAMENFKDELIRPTLFYNHYRFCITFKNTHGRYQELDSWVAEVLGNDEEKYRYDPFGQRKLYLTEEKDILLVRLAFMANIVKIQKIILRKEIEE